MNRPVLVLFFVVLLQTLCVGANFTTLQFFAEDLGRSGVWVGLLWFALTVPRALLSPLWGSLSDRIGRKPLLVLGSVGAIGGSLLWAVAESYGVLLASRVVDSALSATAVIAFAVVADTVEPRKRAAGMGLLGAGVMLAFTVGPIMGALVTEAHGFRALGWTMAALQAASLLLILVAFRETRPASARPPREATAPLLPIFSAAVWRRAFSHPQTAGLLAVSFILTAGYTVFNTAFPNAAARWYDWTQAEVAWAFVVLGLTAGLAQGGLVRPLVPRLGEARVILIGGSIMAVGFGLLGLSLPPAGSLIVTGVIALGGGIAIPSLAGLLSRGVGEDDQGLVLGLNQTAQGIGRGLGPLVGSLVMVALPAAPFWIAAVLVAAATALLAWQGRARMRPPTRP